SPSLEGTDQVMSQLRENMTTLQGQMRDIEAQLKRSSNATLSAEGHWLRAETSQGFRPLERYEQSGEPERIAGKRLLAHAHKLWRDLHDDPKKTCTDEQARELFDVVAALYASEMQTAEELALAYQEQTESSEFLAQLPADQIAAFILKRRRENA